MYKYNQIELYGGTFHEEGSSELYFSYRFRCKKCNKVVIYEGWDSIDYGAIDWTDAEEPERSIKEYIKNYADDLINKPDVRNRSALFQYIYNMSEQLDVDYSVFSDKDFAGLDEYCEADIESVKTELKGFGFDFEMSYDLLCMFVKQSGDARSIKQQNSNVIEIDITKNTNEMTEKEKAAFIESYDLMADYGMDTISEAERNLFNELTKTKGK